MSLHVLLSGDELMKQVFTVYLQLPIFPVSLQYQCNEEGTGITVCIFESSRPDLSIWKDPQAQANLINWAESWRLQFFAKSSLYTEYRCCIEINSKRRHADYSTITYAQFKHFQQNLIGTKGDCHLKIWLSIKRLFPPAYNDLTIPDEFDFNKLYSIYKSHQLTMDELKLPQFPIHNEPLTKIKWAEYILNEIMDRISCYWWPRAFPGDSTHSTDEIDGQSDLMYNFLTLDDCAGQPFLSYLNRISDDESAVRYQMWHDINTLIMQRDTSSLREFKRAVVTCYSKYSNNDPTDAIGFQTLVHTLFPKSSGDCSVKVFINSLKEINEKNMLCLKRRWSSFLHDDYQSFCSCFPLELRCQLVPTSVKCDNLPVTSESQPKIRRSIRFSSCRKRSNKIKAVATPTSISMFDLIGTPLESLPDLQSLEDFKKYLKTLYGLDSIQYCSLQLWTELILHYKLPKAKQHRQYRKIFNRFLSTSARVPLNFSNTILNDVYALKNLSLKNFSQDLLQFYKLMSTGAGLPINVDKTAGNNGDDKKTAKEFSQFEKSLYSLLIDSTIASSHTMKMFEKYLLKIGPQDCPQLLVNSIHFWIEVHKYQIIQTESASSPSFLVRKISALADRYLDTATPPWTKISVGEDVASKLTSIITSLINDSDNVDAIREASELLAKSKSIILGRLVKHWINFNEKDVTRTSNSVTSTISTKYSNNSISSSIPTIQADCGRRSSMLTYSRMEGLQWSVSPTLSSTKDM